MRPTLLFKSYALLANMTGWIAFRPVAHKLLEQGVAPLRVMERKGHPSVTRPTGDLIWFHAASVGESQSVLTLIKAMGEALPEAHFLITSGTATSAEVLAKRMPPRCQHQFAPLDKRRWLRRFLDHWQPSMAIFVESELWPQMLSETARRDVPMALLNARLSETSVRNWRRFGGTARYLLGLFAMIRTQDQRTYDNLAEIGAPASRLQTGINLKASANALPVDSATFADMRAALADRPVWVASSTHEGEEQAVLEAHSRARATLPDLRLILVPRHPERGDEVAALITQAGLSYERRSLGQVPENAEVYLADTLGETGLWYSLSNVVFLGGSFGEAGGHNPYEPAQAGATVLHGPNVANFTEAYADFARAGGCTQVRDAGDLGAHLSALLSDAEHLNRQTAAAAAFARAQQGELGQLVQDLSALLPHSAGALPLRLRSATEPT